MKTPNLKMRCGAFVAGLSALLAASLPVQANDVLFYENFQDVAIGGLPPVNNAPGNWRTMNAGRSAIPPTTIDGAAFALVEDEENAFGRGVTNRILRFDSAQNANLGATFPSREVVTMSFDFIGRDPGHDARWINIRLNGEWDATAQIFSLRTANANRSIRQDGVAIGNEVKYGEKGGIPFTQPRFSQ